MPFVGLKDDGMDRLCQSDWSGHLRRQVESRWPLPGAMTEDHARPSNTQNSRGERERKRERGLLICPGSAWFLKKQGRWRERQSVEGDFGRKTTLCSRDRERESNSGSGEKACIATRPGLRKRGDRSWPRDLSYTATRWPLWEIERRQKNRKQEIKIAWSKNSGCAAECAVSAEHTANLERYHNKC
ncbi:hypothetical protein EJB05_54520, partial [Eragrostis curvula]